MICFETQKVDLKGVPNARQMGGYVGYEGKHIKSDTILRTGTLYKAEKEAIELLEEKYRISDIVDFRMLHESNVMPDPELKGARYHHFSVLNELNVKDKKTEKYVNIMNIPNMGERYLAMYESKMRIDMIEVYRSITFSDEGKKGYSGFFDVLLGKKENSAVLFHCTEGKDRTGIAAILLLSALGVDNETIKTDYLMTNEASADIIRKIKEEVSKVTDDEDVIEFVMFIKCVNEKFIKPIFEIAEKEYGGIIGYIKTELGLSGSDIADLRKIYLE
ncbi:MAG: tyrosine-protein phosphatase [Firmicutes bacterium]|nr:tyrosine-protein phosphatase [Bacillota bacterium]